MKLRISLLAFCLLLSFSLNILWAADVHFGTWRLDVNEQTAHVSIYHNNVLIIKDNHWAFKNDETHYDPSKANGHSVSQMDLSDQFGVGKRVAITSTTDAGITVTHTYDVYSDYVLTELTIESEEMLASNYMAPVYTTSEVAFLPTGYNRTLFVPFDNDGFVRFGSHSFQSSDTPKSSTSYEAGALYNNVSRQGLILGSVEHFDWKTGVVAHTSKGNTINSIEVYGGITSEYTRDTYYKNDGDKTEDNGYNNNRTNIPTPHGKIKAKRVKSPKVFIGYYADWRKGMDAFGDANAIVAPKALWESDKPFGWNSWGVLQDKINYQNASETAAFIKDELVDFSEGANDIYIGLDAGGGKIGEEGKMEKFIAECKARGQKVGGYMNTFVGWGNPYGNGWADAVGLKSNGEFIRFDGAFALDPTHPSVLEGIKNGIESHIAQGFDYVKIDFMSHGAVEADSYYDKDVHTGIQAYNKGMQEIYKYAKGRIYVNLSIAPIFPAHYAQSRRISCDAWNTIDHTKYVLNCLSYGWWLDRVYHYNDADHVVLQGARETENRSRITSSIITGIFILGDDFSVDGTTSAVSKERAFKLLTNGELINVARQCRAFRPVESGASGTSDAAHSFFDIVEDTMYVATFNYYTTGGAANRVMDFDKLGLTKGTEYVVRELWSGEETVETDTWTTRIDLRDVKLFKIFPKNGTPRPTKQAEWKEGGNFPADWLVDGRLIWGDYNNDGYKDAFFVAGQGGGNVGLYTNNEGAGFVQAAVSIPPLSWASAAFVDYNNDGNLDLIVSGRKNEEAGNRQIVTYVYKNSGAPDYTFVEDTQRSAELPGITSGSAGDNDRPGRYLVAFDYNNDGWTDLVMTGLAEDGNHTTALYKNEQGTFVRQNTLVDGGDFIQVSGGSIHVGDVTGNGYADLFVQGWNGDNKAGLYLNKGDGTFSRSEALSGLFNPSQGAETVFVDINGDGYDDIVEINGGAAKLFINNKNNTFTAYDEQTTGLTRSGASSIAAGDVNNDGKVDLLICGFNITTKVYYNNGDNTFTGVDVPASAIARSGNVNLVDINGDRTLDLSNFGYGGNWVNTYLLNDLKTSGIPTNLNPRIPTGLKPVFENGVFKLSWSAAADALTPRGAIRYNVYAKDKKSGMSYFYSPADLKSGKLKTGGSITKLINQTSIEWRLPDGEYTFGVQAVDQSDVASEFFTVEYPIRTTAEAYWSVGETLGHHLQSGQGVWGDYNNDGLSDLFIVGGKNGGEITTALYQQTKDGKLTRVQADNNEILMMMRARAVFIDYDNDGDLDLVVMGAKNNGVNEVVVLENTGAANNYKYVRNTDFTSAFLRHAFTQENNCGRGLIAFDYDNDGWTDLLVSSDVSWNTVTGTYATALYRNMQGEGFQRQLTAIDGGEFRHIAQGSIHVADINGDGYLDIYNQGRALLPSAEDVGYIYINNQDGTFTQTAAAGFVPQRYADAALVDVDGDGYPDIVEVTETTATIYLNDQKGNFVKQKDCGLKGGQGAYITAGDVNNDGHMDLFISGNDIITRVYYNYGDNTFESIGVPLELTARGGSASLVDIDGDGTLDIFSFGWQNDWKCAYAFNDRTKGNLPGNNAPTAPGAFKVEFAEGTARLSWDKATDDHTPQNALRYNIYARNNGTGSIYMYAPADIETGFLRVSNLIPLIQTTSIELKNLPAGQYTFGVQAVDQSNVGGLFTTANATGIEGHVFKNIKVQAISEKRIQIENGTKDAVHYQLISTGGQVVEEGTCDAFGQQTSSNLQSGVYMVKLSQSDKFSAVKITIL